MWIQYLSIIKTDTIRSLVNHLLYQGGLGPDKEKNVLKPCFFKWGRTLGRVNSYYILTGPYLVADSLLNLLHHDTFTN